MRFKFFKQPLGIIFELVGSIGQRNDGAGIGSYRTAWKILGKLRSCTVSPSHAQLSGVVEVDQAFVGGVNNKEIVLIAAEKRVAATGRIRLKHVQNEKADQTQGFIKEVIALGSTIVSDRHKSYPGIIEKGYSLDPQKKPYFWEEVDGDDDRLLPHVGRVTSLLKRWYYDTYRGRVDKESLQSYLDEFTFRFNRRTSLNRGLVFHRMVEVAIRSGPKPS